MVIRQDEVQEAMRLFREGRSKAEIGRAIGKDKKQVGKLIAAAIKHKEDSSHGND